MKTNKSCALYAGKSNSSKRSSSGSLPSPRVSAAVSSIRGDASRENGSGDEDDGGEHDEEEEEPLVLGPDGDLTEADASNLSAEVLRAQWTVEELDVESLPNTSNRSGYVARVVNSRIPTQVLGPNRKAGAKNIPRDIEERSSV